MLFAALALFAFQLAHAQTSSAATGIACLPTGLENVTTDQRSYDPGSTVHIAGMGYAPNCDVVIQVTRPDGSVVTGDGTSTPGSDTVTTALLGSFSYDYQLQAVPPIEGTYVVEVPGAGDVVLARMTFHDANNDANIAPGWAPTNTVTTFSTLYRKTTGGTVQHVRITLPVGYSNISVFATKFSSGTWSAPTISQANRTIDFTLTGGTGLATNNVDYARVDVTATTPAANQNNNAAEWLMQTFDKPPARPGNRTTTRPSSSATRPTRPPPSPTSSVEIRLRRRLSFRTSQPATVTVPHHTVGERDQVHRYRRPRPVSARRPA